MCICCFVQQNIKPCDWLLGNSMVLGCFGLSSNQVTWLYHFAPVMIHKKTHITYYYWTQVSHRKLLTYLVLQFTCSIKYIARTERIVIHSFDQNTIHGSTFLNQDSLLQHATSRQIYFRMEFLEMYFFNLLSFHSYSSLREQCTPLSRLPSGEVDR